MKKNVHILYGQGGYFTSIGMNTFGNSLKPKGYSVTFWNWSQHAECQKAVESSPADKNAIVGYSLGGNACAWIGSTFNLARTIDLLVAYDPTINGPSLALYPIRANVKRAICYRQTSFIGTSMFYGRGMLVRAANGPAIEEVRFTADHLYVPFIKGLHDRTLAALEAM